MPQASSDVVIGQHVIVDIPNAIARQVLIIPDASLAIASAAMSRSLNFQRPTPIAFIRWRSFSRSTGRSSGTNPSLFPSAASICFGLAPKISARRFAMLVVVTV